MITRHHLTSILLTFTLGITISLPVQSQKRYSLQECVEIAYNNNLSLKNQNLSIRQNEINITQSRHARYPSLSGNTNLGLNFGRTIDPTRNEFITETFFNNGFSLNSSMLIYNAGRVNNTIKQNENELLAVREDKTQAQKDIGLNVATFYLNTLVAKENLKNAENQLKITQDQINALQTQILLGSRPENDVFDLEAQLARNEQTQIESENQLNIALVNLKNLLRIPVDASIDIITPQEVSLTVDPDLISFDELYSAAMQNQNRVEAARLRVKSAELGQKIAQSAYFPTVGLGGSLQTNYSNKGFDITGTDQVINFTDVVINGQNVSVGFPSSIPIFEKTPYFNQVTDNLSYGIGMNVSIPIYSNYNARAGVQRSKINTDLANLNFEQIKDNLKIEVSQALNDAKAAKSRYRAAEKSKIASENLYKNTKKRYDIGSAGTFELIQNKTLLDNAVINETISKFDYIFRTKILEFYLGLPLTL